MEVLQDIVPIHKLTMAIGTDRRAVLHRPELPTLWSLG